MSNTFGSCESGSAAAPTMLRPFSSRYDCCGACAHLAGDPFQHFGIDADRLGWRQLSIAMSGDSATVRDGTGRPDAEAA